MKGWSTYSIESEDEELGMEVQVFNLSTQEPEKGSSLCIRGRPSLHSELQISRDYVAKSCHNKINYVF